MKRPQRTKKVAKWALVSGVFSLAILLPFIGASLAYQVAPQNLRFAQTIAGLPLVSFWLPMVPQGKFGDLPTSVFVVGVMVILGMLAVARLKHHMGRLKAENRARDLQDI